MHGEYRHLKANAEIAQSLGIPKENIFIIQSGDVIELSDAEAKIVDKVHTGAILVDGLGVGDVGNVVLRDKQYRTSMDEDSSLGIAKNCMIGKVYNARWVLERSIRDHSMQIDVEKVKHASLLLKDASLRIRNCESKDSLRGCEGEAASVYFGVFDELILQQKKDFAFSGRNRRPPTDNVNAMLSFVYTLLTNHIASALETVGLDPYVGVLHTERPGRVSLALDLIEELRPVLADRFVLSMINKKIVQKKDLLTHPYLQEKIEWGMVPYVQAMLLARYLRGDLDAYPPFLWK